MSQDEQKPTNNPPHTQVGQGDTNQPDLTEETRQAPPPRKKGKLRRIGSWLNPFTTTSLATEKEIQRQVFDQTKQIARQSLKNLREKREYIDEEATSTVWSQLGIQTEAELDTILLRLLKKRNFSLLVTLLCGILLLVSIFLGMPLLASIVCLVLMLEGGIEYMKASWYLYCLSNDIYISFWSFLVGKR